MNRMERGEFERLTVLEDTDKQREQDICEI